MRLSFVFVVLSVFLLFIVSFSHSEDRAAEVHLKNLRQLTNEGDNGEAYWSWDSKRLIFQSSRGGKDCDRIWMIGADGSDPRMVSPDAGANTCSFFLPGDGKIVFSSTSGAGKECPPRPKIEGQYYVWPLWPYDIYTADADGSNLKKITDNPGYDAEPVASSAGGRIVFGSKREGDFDIYSMNPDGSDVKRLTSEVGYDGGPWWSPDGKLVAYRAWHPETDEEKALWADMMKRDYIVPVPLDIWVMNADGSEKKRLTKNGAVNWAPSFHPDGKRIVFSSNMDDWREDRKRFGHNFELYIMDLDGSGLTRLTYNDNFDSFPMFSPDGKKLAFGSNRTPDRPRQTDIFVCDFVW